MAEPTNDLADGALSKDQVLMFRRLLGKTPVIALPHGGMSPLATHPKTVEQVFVIVEKIVETLKAVMAREQALRDEADAITRDLAGAGRVLARMGLTSNADVRSALKAVEAAVMIRPEFTREDVHEIAEKHGVTL